MYDEISGTLVKETDEMVLVCNGDGTATWYAKALLQNIKRQEYSQKITFTCNRNAKVRNVRLA